MPRGVGAGLNGPQLRPKGSNLAHERLCYDSLEIENGDGEWDGQVCELEGVNYLLRALF